jgi:hypothetical protein
MHSQRLAAFALGGVLGALAIPACDLEVPDLNNPGIDDLINNPTPITLGAAATGLLIGNRTGHGAANGYVSQLGIVGRESYNFDSADPRYIRELLEQTLNPGSPFGGAFWAAPYANIKLANIILTAVDKVPDTSDADKNAIRGFARTIAAIDLLRVIVTHDSNGAVADTSRALTDELAPITDKGTVLTTVAKQLDDAVPNLKAAGDTFPFLLDEGFSGFDTPATFLKFNRAIRARVAAYQGDYATVLTALQDSFIADAAVVDPADTSKPFDIDLGVYYTYTTKGGDVTLGLNNPNIYAHPSVTTGAAAGDDRLARKVVTAKQPGQARGLSSTTTFTLYTKPTSSVSLIRNEELVLLKAEALFMKTPSDVPGALAELNLVRVRSGHLLPITAIPTRDEFIQELLYERRYSLLFEGHRLIDLRRFNLTDTLPLDKDTHKRNIRWPIPQPECDARGGTDPACKLGST